MLSGLHSDLGPLFAPSATYASLGRTASFENPGGLVAHWADWDCTWGAAHLAGPAGDVLLVPLGGWEVLASAWWEGRVNWEDRGRPAAGEWVRWVGSGHS